MNRKIFRLSLTLLAAVLMFSCSKDDDSNENQPISGMGSPVTEKSDNYNITYQYEDGVLVLNNRTQRYLSKVVEDSILYFLPEMPDSIMPEVGTIISSRISDKTPYGLGNIVISKEEEDGLVKLVTTVAPLDDIFKELDVKSEFTMEDLVTDISSIKDEEGNTYEVRIKDIDEMFPNDVPALTRWQARASVGSDRVLEIPIKIETESGLFSEIKIVIGAVITFNKNKTQGTFEYSFEPSVGIVGEFGAKKEKDLGEQIQKLLTLIKKTRLFSTHLPIAGGLIDLRPYVDFNADFVGSIEGKISVGFSYYARFKCGWNENGFFKENTSTEWDLKSIFNSFELKGKAEIGPEATISTGCGLYTTDIALSLETKPSILVGADLGVSGDSKGIGLKVEDQKVTLDVAVDLEGNGKVSLIGKDLFAKEVKIAKWNLYNKEWPLFPFLLDNSFNVEHRSKVSSRSNSRVESSEVFDANYSLTGGLMTRIMKGKPAIRVEKDSKEVYTIVSQKDAFVTEQTDLTYELSNLEKNVKYRAYPCIVIGENVYEWDGLDFSYSEGICPDDNHPHAIDLGLPSGTKWACCNLGASKPEEYGEYYDYQTAMTKSIPTWTQILELISYTTSRLDKEWETFTSYNGQSIILPYAGWTLNEKYVGVGSSNHIWFIVDDDPNAFPVAVWGWNPGLSVPEGDIFTDKFSIRTVSQSN